MRDTATVIGSSSRPTAFIGLEFRPHGAYRFLDVSMADTTNGHFACEELFGRWGRDLREAVGDAERVGHKVSRLQAGLVARLRRSPRSSPLADAVVATLRSSHGLTSIAAVARSTGYSRRYLDRLFRDNIGLPPKTLATIFRFQRFYTQWARGQQYEALRAELCDSYYDQSHFAREFKRFTDRSPRAFMRDRSNEFGRRLART